MDRDWILAELDRLGDPAQAAGMARFGIRAAKVYGVKVPELRRLARNVGRDQRLAEELWNTNSRETRILASMVAEPRSFTSELAEAWARDFDSWEICDQTCMNLLEKTPYAYLKAAQWSTASQEFVKRAGFVLMARLAVSDKTAPDARFLPFLEAVDREAGDGRTLVGKGVNWALRQIGKRNMALHERALALASALAKDSDPRRRWVGSDALRELESEAVRNKLADRAAKKS